MSTPSAPPIDADFQAIPPGDFEMGATEDDKFASGVEWPRHRVVIAYPLWVARGPVLVKHWRAYLADRSGAHRPACLDESPEDLPVVGVSWQDAMGYVDWLNQRTGAGPPGRSYRLLSEAEWEYCCRAGNRTVFNTGSNITPQQANYLSDEHGQQVGPGRLVPVGSYPANGFGLFDMHGNVQELVADLWHADYQGAPKDGSAWRTDPTGHWPYQTQGEDVTLRVLRGGGWDGLPRTLRCAHRDWIAQDQRLETVGLRLACAASLPR